MGVARPLRRRSRRAAVADGGSVRSGRHRRSSTLVTDMSGPGASALGRMAPRVASAFRASPEPFVLMLDDLQEIRSPACHDVLSVAISGIPTGSQLVVASRSEQPHLPRLRAAGDALELGVASSRSMRPGPSKSSRPRTSASRHDLAEIVTERTEGWPAGVYLAALIARDGKGDALRISGDDRYVADYLHREAFSSSPRPPADVPAPHRGARAAVGAAVRCLAPAHWERRRVLRELEASSHFLVPLDGQRELVPIPRAVPRVPPRRSCTESSPTSSRSSTCARRTGTRPTDRLCLALEHLLITAERDRCVALVTTLILPTYATGQMATVLKWLADLGTRPSRGIRRWPSWPAGCSPSTGRRPRPCGGWPSSTTRPSTHVPARRLAPPSSRRGPCCARSCARPGPSQAVADADARRRGGAAWSPWRDIALGARRRGPPPRRRCRRGRSAASRRRSTHGRPSPTPTSTPSGHLALSRVGPGHLGWRPPSGFARRSSAIDANRTQDYVTSGLAYVAAARSAPCTAVTSAKHERQLTRGMRVRPHSTRALPRIAVRLRLQLAKVHWSTRRARRRSRHLLREIDDLLRHRPEPRHARRRGRRLPRDRPRPRAQVGTGGAAPLSPAELRLLPYLQTHFLMREIAEQALRLPQHGQLAGELHLPEARGRLREAKRWSRPWPSGCSATEPATAAPSRLGVAPRGRGSGRGRRRRCRAGPSGACR